MTSRATFVLALVMLAGCGQTSDPAAVASEAATAAAMRQAVEDTDAAMRDARAVPPAATPVAAPATPAEQSRDRTG